MFLYACVDLLGFYKPGVVEDILDGRVWTLAITQTWAVGALVLVAIPISMVFLSVTLPARANRAVNIVVASLYVVVSVGNVVGESWAFFFALAAGLEVVVRRHVGARRAARRHPPSRARSAWGLDRGGRAALALVLRCAWTWRQNTSP